MRIAIILAAGLLAFASAGHADKMVRTSRAMPPRVGGPQCVLQEQVTLSVNFNKMVKSFAEAKAYFDQQGKQIAAYAAQNKIGRLELQNQNLNISSQQYNSGNGLPEIMGYQVNGGITYSLSNLDEATRLAELLAQKKLMVSLNSNSYRQGNCNQPAD